MIIYYTVGNFRAIKDPLTLNFQASALSEHPNSNTFNEMGIDLLKSMLLYGHNASGKSKILDSLVFVRYLVTQSANVNQKESWPYLPFSLNSETLNQPSFFEIFFVIDKMKYRYGFELGKEGIQKEWLLESKTRKETPLFLRIEDDFKIDLKKFKNADGLEKRTRKNALFISVAAQWNVLKAEKIVDFFQSIFAIHGVVDHTYKSFTMKLLQDEKYSKTIKEFINKADLGISDIGLALLTKKLSKREKISKESLSDGIDDKDDKDDPVVYTSHPQFDGSDKKIGDSRFYLDTHESEGTRKYFNILGPIIYALYNNKVVIIDEFDARLHSLLTKAILKLFNSSSIQSKGQLLVATHDTSLLDRNILRRDQIGFVEKDYFGASKLTMLSAYKPRKEAPFDKNYLEGKYGGIPIIEEFEKIIAHE